MGERGHCGCVGRASLLRELMKVVKEEIKQQQQVTAAASASVAAGPAGLPGDQSAPRFALEINLSTMTDQELLDGFVQFTRRCAGALGLAVLAGPAALPTGFERWTVLASPFVHKTARTQFERRTHARALSLGGFADERMVERVAWYLQQHAPHDVALRLVRKELLPDLACFQ